MRNFTGYWVVYTCHGCRYGVDVSEMDGGMAELLNSGNWWWNGWPVRLRLLAYLLAYRPQLKFSCSCQTRLTYSVARLPIPWRCIPTILLRFGSILIATNSVANRCQHQLSFHWLGVSVVDSSNSLRLYSVFQLLTRGNPYYLLCHLPLRLSIWVILMLVSMGKW